MGFERYLSQGISEVLGCTLVLLRNLSSLKGQKPLRSFGLGALASTLFLFVACAMFTWECEGEWTTESKSVLKEERFDESDIWRDMPDIWRDMPDVWRDMPDVWRAMPDGWCDKSRSMSLTS